MDRWSGIYLYLFANNLSAIHNSLLLWELLEMMKCSRLLSCWWIKLTGVVQYLYLPSYFHCCYSNAHNSWGICWSSGGKKYAFSFDMCSTVEPQDVSRDFDHGFQPILSWLRIIGVDSKGNQPNKCKHFFSFYRVGCFLFSISTHLMLFFCLVDSTKEGFAWIENEKDSQTFTFIIYLDRISDFVHPVGIQFLLLIQFRKGWKALWNSLDALHQLITPEFYKYLRKISTLGVVYIITQVSSNSEV